MVGDERFALRAIVVDPPLVKTFPADESDSVSDDLHVEVAVDDGRVCGFVVVGVRKWAA